jgi:(p)ppGpp synthase/HD superfamily hydrolase
MWSPDLYLAALRFAGEKHQGQTVPGSGLPYVVHLSSVAMEVMGTVVREPFGDPDLAVQCALLHDTIEDTKTTFEEVEAQFGRKVAEGVRALTKDPGVPKADQMQDSLQRIRSQPREIWIVKLADRITNLQPPPAHWTAEKRRRYLDEAEEIHRALHSASAHLSKRMREKMEAYRAFLEVGA